MGQLCTQWEAKADQFINLGCKVSKVRTGIVLSSNGGALPKMMFPIIWWLGAALGSGKQFIPWVHIDIAGVAQTKSESDYAPAGATGWGVMTLDTLVKNNFERG